MRDNIEIKVVLDEGAYMPEKAHEDDAGLDLRTREWFEIKPNSYAVVDTGVHTEIPSGYVGFIKSKSGLNVKKNIVSEGVIDAGYTGPIVVKLYNHGNDTVAFSDGDKITQLVILPIPQVTLVQALSISDTDRGNNGFGSSGR